jgi:hypothetical protein
MSVQPTVTHGNTQTTKKVVFLTPLFHISDREAGEQLHLALASKCIALVIGRVSRCNPASLLLAARERLELLPRVRLGLSRPGSVDAPDFPATDAGTGCLASDRPVQIETSLHRRELRLTARRVPFARRGDEHRNSGSSRPEAAELPHTELLDGRSFDQNDQRPL